MSAGDKSVYLKAGQLGFPVRAGGDFIFLKESARPVRVIVDGQPIVMRAGDKRVMLRKEAGRQAFESFDVDNISDVDLRIVFVVGDGDYNSQIVSGEMNVSAYVLTAARGVANSLPMMIERVVGVDNENVNEYTNSYEVMRTPSFVGFGSSEAMAFWFVDRFYFFDVSGLWWSVKLSTPTGELFESGVWDSNASQVQGCTVTPEGVVYYRSADALYKMRVGNFFGVQVALNAKTQEVFASTLSAGLHYWRGRLYTLSGDGSELISVDEFGLDLRYHSLEARAVNLYGLRDVLTVEYITGHKREHKINSIGSLGEGVAVVVSTVIKGALDESGLYSFSHDFTGGYRIKHYRTVTTYGRLYIHPVGSVERKEFINLYSPVNAYDSKVGRVVVNDWVGVILKGLGGGDDYRDYVTGYSYDNGVVTKEMNTGTQSFSYRGVDVPELAALNGSTIKINILPDYF